MKKRITLIVVALAVAGIAVFLLTRTGDEAPNRIPVSGNIELTEIQIAFKTTGRLLERTVDEGDEVKKGMVVARLDRDNLEAQREREAASLALDRAQLAQAETALAWQRESFAANLAERRADLAAVEARLGELRNGSRPEEIEEARAAVTAAEAEFERARRDWERAERLYEDDDISTAQFDQYRSRREAAESALTQARQRQALALAGPRREQVEAAAAQVERARAAVRTAENNRLEIRKREQELPLRRAEIDRAAANLALIDAQIADTVAVSPVDGVVLVKSAEPGEILPAGTPVLAIGDIRHPWLRAYIGATDYGRVKLGTRARVTTDSYPDKVYEGRVSFISSEAEFTPKQIQTREERVKLVYRIKIDLANPDQELKSNMPADAVLEVE